ncbi:Ioc3p NDAI_0H03530 [Naumovozyma dairenensis CBS 421]|uniref:WHIM1 domain-containing protein n=1 Tax=Naumovozyma dairenensis (strain ATCC 10597 / BCRC 20456 / CBS 421 / NBRC 0211 / NRRL Y-12639) TaxID=1071378 RepID=G0WFG5_NAUDC|nr:hypothetical protein NDAI_0H03530 [Naumovozyma dairenensis CBS 421]CCD26526.1 hypothetical protein NDAI_0H03530 [Naumovozyma dairenensis CBS 421]
MGDIDSAKVTNSAIANDTTVPPTSASSSSLNSPETNASINDDNSTSSTNPNTADTVTTTTTASTTSATMPEADKATQNITATLEKEVPPSSAVTIDTKEPSIDLSALGLRRSARVRKPRTDLALDEAASLIVQDSVRKPKAKPKAKAKPKKKVTKVKAKNGETTKTDATKKKNNTTIKSKGKGKIEKKSTKNQKLAATTAGHPEATTTAGKIATPINKVKKAPPPPIHEPDLNPADWSSNVPLLSNDIKSQQSIISRLKNPNMKLVPYAGDVIKIMSFINKFNRFLTSDLQNLSFQDFEIGLNLYPELVPSITPKQQQQQTQLQLQQGRVLLYQDYIPIKEVVAAQDKMNLLFYSLVNLLFTSKQNSEFEPMTMEEFLQSSSSSKKSLLNQLRSNSYDWGYPREWRTNNKSSSSYNPDKEKKPISALFPMEDQGPFVDPKEPIILTKNIYQWDKNDPLPIELNPLQSIELEKTGLLALLPKDRIILLRTLINWCIANSNLIHGEIQHLTHFKKDPAFSVQTQHVPRYLVEGMDTCFVKYGRLCALVEKRFDIRRQKKHFKKLIKQRKNEDFANKLNILNEIKEYRKSHPELQNKDINIELYDKWNKLFETETNDDPIRSPFDDELYKLRSHEFFIGRVPHMGDFYLPRLQTYCETESINTYTDLLTLKKLMESFKSGEFNTFQLFENYGQLMSSQFKIFYHDSPSLIRDTMKGVDTMGKPYWYEMCHDCNSLKEFIELLSYKIELPKEDDNKMEATPDLDQGTDDSTINKHPLPKDPRYNTARNKLRMLRDYLSDMYYILVEFEKLKTEYAGMNPGKRQLRRMQRNPVNYNTEYDSDIDMDEDETGGIVN